MAAEARAMLDALMGSDRDTSLPSGASVSKLGKGDTWEGSHRANKKSCYDRDICPLYCAWGVDVYDLFTNTKSDLGPNPYIVQEDAREEFISLPGHEKERLGYEHILYRKLGDLVRGCDRIVSRNKDKLRAEVAKVAKARGAEGNRIDPVTEVKEEVLLETAECMADLELLEEEVEEMVEKLCQLDKEWKESWKRMNFRAVKSNDNGDHSICKKDTEVSGEAEENKVKESNESSIEGNVNSSISIVTEVLNNNSVVKEDTIVEREQSITKEEEGREKAAVKTEISNSGNVEPEVDNKEQSIAQKEASIKDEKMNGEVANLDIIDTKDSEAIKTLEVPLSSDEMRQLKSKLFIISTEQQKLISALVVTTSLKIMPLRENLQGLQKQIYYIRSDTSSDKTVCEISGNFMSSRDAEERIAAHYAGKQYVGWKMVRDKYRELHQKCSSQGRGPPMMGRPQRGAPHGQRGGPPGNYSHRVPSGGYGSRGPIGYQHNPSGRYSDRDRRDRSRSREREPLRSRASSARSGRKNSPSRWERDRYTDSNDGSHSHGHGSGRHGARRDDRGRR